jgi:hypothetical protein
VSISRYGGLLASMLIFILAAPAYEAESEAGDRARNRQLLEKWKTDAEHYARLQRDLRDFWALPEAKRQHLRRLDKELHDLDAKTRKQLWKVAERYTAWLERLPEDERRRIEATEDLGERLALIKEIRERQWIERLPQKVREELDKLSAEERAARVAQLREQERQQRKLWQGNPRSKPPTRLADLPPEARVFVQKHLLPHLTAEEKAKYDAAVGLPEFPRLVKELAKHHPVLPPLPPPGKAIVRFNDLPAKAKVEAGSEAAWEKRRDVWERLRKVEGKWPEWALLFHSLLTARQQSRMPSLGASRPSEFPREVADFLRDKLEPKLTSDEKQHLHAAEGKWPEYPKRLLQLAEKHKLEVPGMSLPAFTEAGNNAR